MQRRYEAVRATIGQFKKPVPVPKKPYTMYDTNSSDYGPPRDEANTLNKTDTTEMHIPDSLLHFIEALTHLETIHHGFYLQKSNNTACFLCSSAHCITLWRDNNELDFQDEDFCKNTAFNSNGPLQCCDSKGNDYAYQPCITFEHCITNQVAAISRLLMLVSNMPPPIIKTV